MKLNLGCGNKIKDGWVNVDQKSPAEVIHDLNSFPWPFEDNSFDEIEAIHVLEHLGKGIPENRIKIIKELYRIAKNGCFISIIVPNPQHTDFLDDPTHCWPITPSTFQLFDQEFNKNCIKNGFSNSTLGLDYGVNFAIKSTVEEMSWMTPHPSILSKAFVKRHLVNSIASFRIHLEVIKEN